MNTKDNAEFYAHIKDTIDNYGHNVIGVFSDGTTPSFAYSIGLFPKLGYELLVIGLNGKVGTLLINRIAAMKKPQFDVPLDCDFSFPMVLKKCTQLGIGDTYTIQAEQYYQQTVPVVQIVLPDRNGIFPWEANFDVAYMGPRQPLLF